MREALLAFFVTLPVGTFVEYWGHRMMHAWLLKRRHARHHQQGSGQGWLGEFRDYSLGTVFILPVGFLYSREAGIGIAFGGLFYAAFAAYSHQLQHEKPELCFWMKRPAHFLHHRERMWHTNFGISFDLWDRVFGTYKKVDWNPQPGKRDWRQLFRITWA